MILSFRLWRYDVAYWSPGAWEPLSVREHRHFDYLDRKVWDGFWGSLRIIREES